MHDHSQNSSNDAKPASSILAPQLQKQMQTSANQDCVTSHHQQSSQSQKMLPTSWIERIWVRMFEIYPISWPSRFFDETHEEGVKKQWAIALANLTGAQISHAFDVCRDTMPSPPSIAEFITFAQKNTLKSAPEAFLEAVEQAKKDPEQREWTHPLILATYAKIGSWRFRNDTEANLRREFTQLYIELRSNPEEVQKTCSEHENSVKTDPQENLLPLKFTPGPLKTSTCSIQAIVDQGAVVCKLLKKLNPDTPWPKISELFVAEKKKARVLAPNLDELQILILLQDELHKELRESKTMPIAEPTA